MRFIQRYCLREFTWVREKTSNRKQRLMLLAILSPYLFIKMICVALFNVLFGAAVTSGIQKKESYLSYKDKLAVVAIGKDEGPYVKEWIEYYILQGVDRFYIYDNESTDDFYQVLKPYIDRGIVVYKKVYGRARQLDVYNEAMWKCRKDTQYVAFFDFDEFLVQTDEKKSLYETIDEIMKSDKNAGGVAVNWHVYGSAGHKTKPQGLVIENYLQRGDEKCDANDLVKVICSPRQMLGFLDTPHFPEFKKGSYCILEDGSKHIGPKNPYPNNHYDKLRLNHYYCKSVEECEIKFARGGATDEVLVTRKWDQYHKFDRNEIHDEIMLRYAKKLKV